MMFCEHDVSVSNHYMQQVSVIKHPDVPGEEERWA